MYFPPAGGAGVQRPLKLSRHLADLGFEVHVVAPDDPKWIYEDASLRIPENVTVHRVKNHGPRARIRSEELAGAGLVSKTRTHAAVQFRRVLRPDASVIWSRAAGRAATRLVEELGIDAVLTTSPPISVNLAGLHVQKKTGVPWVADLRDSFLSPDRRRHVRGEARLQRKVAERADAITAATEGFAAEMRALNPRGPVEVIENGCDFDDFDGLEYRRGDRFRITHTGGFISRRDARPFFEALRQAEGDPVARFVGGVKVVDEPLLAELDLGDRLEVIPFQPHDKANALQKDSDALLLLLAESGEAGRKIISAKVYEYLSAGRPILAAVPPDGEAAALIRETGAGVVVAPDDVGAMAGALTDLERRWRDNELVAPEALRGAAREALPARASRAPRRAPEEGRMTTASATFGRFDARERSATYDGSRVLEVLLFTAAFVITFAKIRIQVAGLNLFLSDLAAGLFVIAFLWNRVSRRDWVVSRTVAIAAGFFVAFLIVYLIAFFNLETSFDRNLFLKGITKWGINFALLLCAVAYLERRSPRIYWETLAAFVAGFTANAAWGLTQLVLAEGGRNLDQMILGRLHLYEKGGINIFGTIGDSNIYRTTGLTFDPNHLGVMLVVPILVVFPIYLRLERGHRLRWPLGGLLAFLVLVELSTLSRSGLLGLFVGLCVLAIPYRHLFLKPRFLVPLGGLLLVLAIVVTRRSGFFESVFTARTQVGGSSAQAHLEFYSLIRPALDQHLFFGLGLNTFSTYFEFLTGKTNFGPHSFYVALLTEAGLVGAALYTAWVVFLFRCLKTLRRVGRTMAAAGDRAAARVRPLGWGLTAALVGTLASNIFYLTMQMYYFTVFAALILAAPVVFSRAAHREE